MKLRLFGLPARPTRRRSLVAPAAVLLGVAVVLPLTGAASASAATTHATHSAYQTAKAHTQRLSGTTTVTTAPGIATTLLRAGILPLPTAGTHFGIASLAPLKVSYGFPITGGQPNLSGPSGDILHSGGINFVARGAHLEIGRFDIDLAAGKIYARQVNFAAARIPVLDLDLSHLAVSTSGANTVLSGISLRLDPAAAGALNATFHIALPTDGSLVFGTGRVVLRG